MSIDLLKDMEQRKPEDEDKKKQMKDDIDQLYGYDSEEQQDEETLINKFMSTMEKMREKRREQMKKMVD